MSGRIIDQFCECKNWCQRTVRIPLDESIKLAQKGYIIIVDGCTNGPSHNDVLVEKRTGYSLYRTTKRKIKK